MTVLISYIVPIYNAERTIRRCVDSLLAQGLNDHTFEIILINDGSTDHSEVLCQELSEKHRCIKTISQQNAGLSEARNRGILAARGEYLCFVDSDDCLTTGGIASLLSFCDGKNDLIRFWCELVYNGSNTNAERGDGCILFSGHGLDYLREFGLETFCWNYLYKKDFLEKNNLFFSRGIISEDFLYMFDVMMANPCIVSVARRIYQFNSSPNSISTTRTPDHSRRWVRDLMGAMSRIAGELEPFRESDPQLFQSCRRSLDNKMNSLFSRCLSAKYTPEEYRGFLSSCRDAGLFPLHSKSLSFIAVLIRFPFLYPFASTIYSRIFLAYIYPKIDRYGE
jgi:glycosyltransferase involved in cell wall biosynthesis